MTSPRFDLAVQGIAGFTRTCLTLPKRKISRDPLSGILDGENKIFHTQYYPLLTSGSLVVFQGAIQVGGVADYDTGEITLTDVPSSQPIATYTFVPFTTDQMTEIVVAGFNEMEARWPRRFNLIETSGSMLIADKDGLEPVCNGVEFTDSVVQIAFLMVCIEYVYYLMALGDSSITDYAFRETTKGMSVDKSKRPGNISLMMRELNDRMKRILEQAQAQYYGGANYGGFIPNLATQSYMLVHEWQTQSALMDYRTTLAYNQPIRSF